jgi:hypothetical protein
LDCAVRAKAVEEVRLNVSTRRFHALSRAAQAVKSAGRCDQQMRRTGGLEHVSPRTIDRVGLLEHAHVPHKREAGAAARHRQLVANSPQRRRLLTGESAGKVNAKSETLRQAFRESGARGYWLKRLEQLQDGSNPEDAPYDMAIISAQLGKNEEALDWLDNAYAKRDHMDYLVFDHYWDELREEPRFQVLLKKVGFMK